MNHHHRHFANAPQSVTLARRFARQVLADVPARVAEIAELLVSELATNCVRHTETPFDLSIAGSRTEVRIEATDRGAGAPVLRHPEPTSPSGRGLQIIDMLSADWGVRQAPQGKTVWVKLKVSGCDDASAAVG